MYSTLTGLMYENRANGSTSDEEGIALAATVTSPPTATRVVSDAGSGAGIGGPGANASASSKSTWQLGDLSARFETGGRSIAAAAGMVSSGVRDRGGISYGAYQLASSAAGGNQVQNFLQHEGAQWAPSFSGLDPIEPGAFGQQWRTIAQQTPAEFFSAQHAYIQRTHYDPVVNYLLDQTGLDIRSQPAAVQDAVWSASVQHGGAKFFLTEAINLADQQTSRSSEDYPSTLINAIYDRRIDYVSHLNIDNKPTLLNIRYPAERRGALQMLIRR
jgi:type VI secretion system secreted protein VgrG